MRSQTEATELRHYFQIKTELQAARRGGRAEDAEFHIGELAGIRLHTTNARLRDACTATIEDRHGSAVDAA